MLRRIVSAVIVGCLLGPLLGWTQNETPIKRETFQNAEVLYDWVKDSQGDELRTFVTQPKAAAGKVPAIFFVGWLSCDSMEYSNGETDAFGAILRRLIDQSGYATLRMDKPGVGESKGNCAQTDFQTELSGYQAAFDSLRKYDFIDLDKAFVVGLSNGGGTAPLSVRGQPVRGYIAASSWGRTWYEHMLELERVRLDANSKPSAGEVNDAMKVFTEFYDAYLIQRLTPGRILQQHPKWKDVWYDELTADGQYGRPAAFYQQLQELNLGETWQKVTAPVLVLHGTADTIMSDADSRAIADIVNRTHPGNARFVEIKGGDHALAVHNKLEGNVVPTMLEWLKEHASAK